MGISLKLFLVLYWAVFCGYLHATDLLVAPSGAPYTTIADALTVAQAGDRVLVQSGMYTQQIVFPRSGNAIDGWIELLAAPGHTPIMDGSGFSGGTMVMISNKNYIRIRGFTIQNLSQINDGGGIRVIGACDHIEILHNTITQMLGQHAMGITVYGTSTTAPIENLLIQGNTIHNCQPSTSEALTLNGNITGFEVLDNLVHDVNNIGIDFIGGETDINPNPSLVARNGLCARNEVYHARSNYGGGWAAGIYIDGGSDITLDANIVWENDLGIEIGAENAGTNAQNIIVRNNRIFHNDKAGLVFGGFDASVGRTVDSFFLNNTLFQNDTQGENLGEIWIQYAQNNIIENNIVFCSAQGVAIYSAAGNVNNQMDYNLWYGDSLPGNTEFVWVGVAYMGLPDFQTTGQAANGLWADPVWTSGEMMPFSIDDSSPAYQRGNPDALPEVGLTDMEGQARIAEGRIDQGADEFSSLSCLPSLYATWRTQTNLPCGGSGILHVLELTALFSGTCSCP